MAEKNIIHITEEFQGEQIEVAYRKGNPGKTLAQMEEARAKGERAHHFNFCNPINQREYEAAPGVICMQDQEITLRDGVRIYADIYLPKHRDEPVPLIISWSPFGKRPAEGIGEWKLMGVPPKTVSHMSKFESADPGFWCYNGYAIANVDPRGVGNSEGNVANFGTQDGRDGYDFIEWAAQQPWCSGYIGMFGNSGVGMTQWRIAAEQPPHLTCIAAWESSGDLYRESMRLGGIDSPNFNEAIIVGIAAKNYVEDAPTMSSVEHPFMDAYWEDKIPKWKNIRIPVYVCSGWCHFHLRGSLEAFRRIRSPRKWLRAHREMEWPDSYNPDNIQDLKRYFDRYLKGIHNGWELTPRIRIDVMDAYDYDICPKRVEKEFPFARTRYEKIYLDASNHGGSAEPVSYEAQVEYDPENGEGTYFEYQFPEDTEITGYMKLRLYVECKGYDNMDLFVWIKKYSAEGEYVPIYCMNEPYRGAWGYMRTKRRELDPVWSTDFQPVQAHRKDEPMEEGQIYPVDVEIWPHSRLFHKGEKIRIEIAGHFIKSEWYEDAKMGFNTDNGNGIHVLHTGGAYESFLQIPVIPPKWKVGDYVYR
ncbi:MAG: CocE/NonD family hydrolase [Parasporobacterium sp.]|nr:CocE/NonD family hydrolase [Parasporobacterium sp.]